MSGVFSVQEFKYAIKVIKIKIPTLISTLVYLEMHCIRFKNKDTNQFGPETSYFPGPDFFHSIVIILISSFLFPHLILKFITIY